MNRTEFKSLKVGDKVVGLPSANENYAISKEGWEGKVTRISEFTFRAVGKGSATEFGFTLNPSHFSRVAETKFKVGQKLKVIGNFAIGHSFKIGDIVTVHEVDDISVYARNECGYGQWVANSDLELCESKFKIGDKVTVKTDLVAYRKYNGITFVSSMTEYIGTTLTISKVKDADIYHGTIYNLSEDSWNFNFTDDMLDLYIEPQFTKRDLKSGYVVKYRSGELRMVMEYLDHVGLVDSSLYHSNSMPNYNDDLTDEDGDNDLDIVAVFGFQDGGKLEVSTKDRELLWERE